MLIPIQEETNLAKHHQNEHVQMYDMMHHSSEDNIGGHKAHNAYHLPCLLVTKRLMKIATFYLFSGRSNFFTKVLFRAKHN